jgi:polygalacturonase
VFIHDVTCGPGHGISIGGLGKDGTTAVVSGISVQNVKMTGTLTAARIKTWQVKIITLLKRGQEIK